MSVDMSPEQVQQRLREASRLSDLRPEHRLDSKVDMSPAAVARRLRRAAALYRMCQCWQRLGEANGLGRAQRLAPSWHRLEAPS